MLASGARWLRRAFRSPFRADVGRPLIVHAGYHKVASVWFENVLRDVAARFGLSFMSTYLPFVERHPVYSRRQRAPSDDPPTWIGDVNLFMQSRHFGDDLFAGRSIRGTHIVRDPRDVAVSGYRYHLWTDEPWVHVPDERYGGLSYQEKLRSLPEAEGMLLEIERTCSWTVGDMRRWDYSRKDFLELRYEDLIEDEDAGFTRIFTHYGFSDAAIASSITIARSHSFQAMTGRKIGEVGGDSHLRSGKPGQWRAEFRPEHVELFKRKGNDVLVMLGYERDDSWTA
jgi:hypothetical protein